MENDLVELFEAAKKAADAAARDGALANGSEEARCLDALKELQKFPITYQVLVSTQIGKRLRLLTKHPREKIQAVASDLLDIWKNIVIEETIKNKKNGSLDDRSAARAEDSKVEIIRVQNTGTVKAERFSKAETVKVEKVGWDETKKSGKVSSSENIKLENMVEKVATLGSEKSYGRETVKVEKIQREVKKLPQAPIGPPKLTSMIKCNDAMRDKVRELLSEALSKVSSEADEDIRDEVDACDPIRVAVSVESVMFEKWGRSNGSQKFKYRSIMFNIKDPNNPDLRRKLLLGHVKPDRLLTMTPEEMASDQRQRENNQIKEKALFECERGGPPKATTDQFKCGRCGQRKCTYYQLQTRSADEPMTTFVTCVNCNNHWKFC